MASKLYAYISVNEGMLKESSGGRLYFSDFAYHSNP